MFSYDYCGTLKIGKKKQKIKNSVEKKQKRKMSVVDMQKFVNKICLNDIRSGKYN